MSWYALRFVTILIIIFSLLFVPPPISRADNRPTETEIKQAQDVARLFLKRLEETRDFARVIDEIYAEGFIERYLQEQILEGAESDSSFGIQFAQGLSCKPELLKQATIEDWRKLYVATNNFFYHILILSLNKSAYDYLNGREPEDEILESLVPAKLLSLFNDHPILKDFIEIDEDDESKSVAAKEERQTDANKKQTGPKIIETPEEMRNVTETLQEGLRLLLEEHGTHSFNMTGDARKALEIKIQAKTNDNKEFLAPRVRVSENEYFGFSPGVRLLEIQTPGMPFNFILTLTEMSGKQRIVWAELLFGV